MIADLEISNSLCSCSVQGTRERRAGSREPGAVVLLLKAYSLQLSSSTVSYRFLPSFSVFYRPLSLTPQPSPIPHRPLPSYFPHTINQPYPPPSYCPHTPTQPYPHLVGSRFLAKLSLLMIIRTLPTSSPSPALLRGCSVTSCSGGEVTSPTRRSCSLTSCSRTGSIGEAEGVGVRRKPYIADHFRGR